MVSDKDRKVAMNAVDRAIGEWCEETNVGSLTRNVLVAKIVNALSALDWGPRPTVSAEDLTEIILQAREDFAGSAYHRLVTRLRECGIEVSDD